MAGRILWDVVEEHLDEASYLLGVWRRALDMPAYTLDRLADGPEARLFAHWDGLVVGGQEVAERLLIPLLRGEGKADADRLVVAALAALDQGGELAVVTALESDTEPLRSAAEEALALGAPPGFDEWLQTQLVPGARGPRGLATVAARRGVPLTDWTHLLSSPDPVEVAAAARGCRAADPARHLPLIEALITHPDAGVRDAALATAVAWRSRRAWRHCLEVAQSATPDPTAMGLLAAIGDPDGCEVLVSLLERPSHRRTALRALGHTGSAAVANRLVGELEAADPLEAKLAAEAISMITGLDTADSTLVAPEPPDPLEGLPPLEQDDLEATLVPPPEAALPRPAADGVRAWCATALPKLDPAQRWLSGAAWSPATAVTFMSAASLPRRHGVSLCLEVASRGQLRIDTRAFTVVQRAQLAAASRAVGRS